MKVYIKISEDNSLFEQAKCGFVKMGYEIIMYDALSEKVELDSIVIGFISDISNISKIMGFKKIKQIDYPKELNKYLKRDFKKLRINELPNKYPYFIKPTSIKSFSGRIVNSFKDLIGVENVELYFTDKILNIVSEYRCFILENKVIGVKHYKGSPYYSLKESVVLDMIKDYKDCPNAYSLDIGITKDNDFVLIECNNAYSTGNYGLSDILYAKFLRQGYIDIAKYE